jgi:hypothetical protein
MVRKIFSGLLIALSAIFLISSVGGIGAIWYYNEPLTREATSQLKKIDSELAQAETTLASSEKELERALRIVDATEEALKKLTEQSGSGENLFENIQSRLDDRLIPELKTTRDRLETARATMENFQSILASISSFLPVISLNLPDQILADLIASASSIDGEIANMEALAKQVSTFVGDASFLLGGDLSETRNSLQGFLSAIQEYQIKVADWRKQDQQLLVNAPKWIDQGSIGLTIFLAWFGLSQFGLLLHGLNLWRGENPMLVLRRNKTNPLLKNARDLELED